MAMLNQMIGALLLIAASLKGYDLLNAYQPPAYWFGNRWFQLAAVEIEILVGFWLLSQVYQNLAIRITRILFLVFVCFALYKALTGAASCGCFGRLHINPWYTVSLDLGVFALLQITKLIDTKQIDQKQALHKRVRLWTVGGLAMASCLFVLLMAWQTRPQIHDADDLLPKAGSLVVLDSERWIGKKFPLLNQIDIGDAKLDHGSWVIVMYHADCLTCQKAIPRYIARSMRSSGESQQLALVEIPPYAKTSLVNAAFPGTLGRLRETHEWFAQTPLALYLEDGRVQKAREGEAAADPNIMFAQ